MNSQIHFLNIVKHLINHCGFYHRFSSCEEITNGVSGLLAVFILENK